MSSSRMAERIWMVQGSNGDGGVMMGMVQP